MNTMSESMQGFFAGTRPGKKAKYGKAAFDLPILYLRDDFFGLYFTADPKKVKGILPSDRMHPVTMPNGRAIVAILAYNYIDTTIGPYGEVPVAIPVLYDRKHLPLMGFLPALRQANYPGFAVLIMHLPVTKVEARDAGRGEWGYTKFIADMRFDITPEFLQCSMSEGDEHILDLRVMRRGFHMRDNKPLITFSVRDRKLIRTVIPQKGTMRMSLSMKGSFVNFGKHPMAKSIQALDISEKPFMANYYTERGAILPSGTVIEENVRPFEGYPGKDRKAKHVTLYTPYGV
ncbi:MAG TPA: acetoacetate decarboxylase family protein [Spirochaetota bacterium]|nr:acetoacetate decarboxylase family protein [Spirochaetota bacterium]HOD13162.1 acetoacetate decarboxylase family protein [Spirochaetota bacterium]HPG49031.1 acetoacetate decarboxylase family protein [Spirochaetota bacterium]HPN10499.1 acetoacetate decarboxylase family protein [Spirochaetota bacterium]HQL81925.1 acetoacetate decarboxylase family protein [Spirochaetota bacterium]